jgi:hypothetical protein
MASRFEIGGDVEHGALGTDFPRHERGGRPLCAHCMVEARTVQHCAGEGARGEHAPPLWQLEQLDQALVRLGRHRGRGV